MAGPKKSKRQRRKIQRQLAELVVVAVQNPLVLEQQSIQDMIRVAFTDHPVLTADAFLSELHDNLTDGWVGLFLLRKGGQYIGFAGVREGRPHAVLTFIHLNERGWHGWDLLVNACVEWAQQRGHTQLMTAYYKGSHKAADAGIRMLNRVSDTQCVGHLLAIEVPQEDTDDGRLPEESNESTDRRVWHAA